MPNPFPSRLIALRESRNWTRYRLARESGLSQGHLASIEKGEVSPSIEVVKKIARALGVSLAKFDEETGE